MKGAEIASLALVELGGRRFVEQRLLVALEVQALTNLTRLRADVGGQGIYAYGAVWLGSSRERRRLPRDR